MAVKFRHRLATQIAMLGLASATVMSLTFAYVIPYVHMRLFDSKKDQIKQTVVLAATALGSGLDLIYTEPNMEEDLKRAGPLIEELSWAGDEYFWLQDFQAKMLIHPIKPELNGRSMWEFQDPDGKYIFQLFAYAVNEGGGFVEYKWPKPGSDHPVAKISYVAMVPGRDWIIGSGLYIDDIEEHIGQMTFSLAAMAGVKLLVVVAACLLLGKSYTRPVNKVLNMAQQVGGGDLSAADIDTTRSDELGEMALALNEMKNSLRDDVRMVVAAAALASMAAREISEGNQDLSNRVTARAEAAEQLSAAVAALRQGAAQTAQSVAGEKAWASELAKAIPDEGQQEEVTGPDEDWTSVRTRFDELVSILGDTAVGAEAQKAAMEEMARAIEEMDTAIREDAALVAQVAAAARNLDDEAQSLIDQMRRFKL